MKTKLLRKVRKRFTIEFNDSGIELLNTTGFYKCSSDIKYKLTDLKKKRTDFCESKNECLSTILYWIRAEYPKLGSWRNKILNQKIWYNS